MKGNKTGPTYYYGEMQGQNHETVLKGYVHEINRFRFNWHPEIELMIVTSGSLEACVEGNIHYMEEDDVLIINSNQGHATLLKQADTQAMVFHLDYSLFQELLEEDKRLWFHCLSNRLTRNRDNYIKIRHLAARLMRALLEEHQGAVYQCRGYAFLLIAAILEGFPPNMVSAKGLVQNKKQDRAFHQMIRYAEKYYNRKITMDDIAGLTGYNKTYLSTLFKNRSGIGYYEYLTRIRLRHGIDELNKTDKTILEIALDTGFADVKSFTGTFKRYFMKTPNQYRSEIKHERSPVIGELVRQFIPLPDDQVSKKLEQYIQILLDDSEESNQMEQQMWADKKTQLQTEVERFQTAIKNILE